VKPEVCTTVLEHAVDPWTMLSEAFRITKQNGYFIALRSVHTTNAAALQGNRLLNRDKEEQLQAYVASVRCVNIIN
jgi:hypothetical protein